MRNYLIGAGMIIGTLAIIAVGSARSQEVGMPANAEGFLCETEAGVHAMLDKMEPDLALDDVKERAKGTSCEFTEKAGIIMSIDGRYTSAHGSTYEIIGFDVEGKTLYTWHLLKAGSSA